MTEDQIKNYFGVDETLAMLQFREHMKTELGPELYEQNMAVHKARLQQTMDNFSIDLPLKAAEVILTLLDVDLTLDPGQREIWKALVLLAAFEMQEF